MKNCTDSIKNLPISDTTALFIACYTNCNDLEDMLIESMKSLYGASTAEKLYEKLFEENLIAIRKAIGDSLLDSVTDNISNKNLKNI